MQTYESYKNSGIDWLGEVPSHWETRKLGNLLKPYSVKNMAHLPLLSITREKGVIVRGQDEEDENHNFIPDDLSGYKHLKKGQFGMNKMKAWQGSYGYSNYEGIVSPAYFIFDIDSKLYGEFFSKTIRSKAYIPFFIQASDGVRIGQWDLSKARMKEITFFVPPISEQEAIAAFLDEKCGKIDELVSVKEQQIALLKERRQVIIHEAVTKGIQPNAELKDSGIDWIGEIPKHWEVKRLKYVLSSQLKYGANESGFDYDENLPRYIRISDFGFDGKLNNNKKLSLPDSIAKDYLLKDGDILFARSGATVGKAYQFKTSLGEEKSYCFAGYLIKAEPDINQIMSDFLNYYTQSGAFMSWKDSIFNKATIENIGADKYSELNVPIPRIFEQEAIVVYLDDQTGKIDQAIALKTEQIEKLKAYKQSLINEVVTGKVKVA
ncbi:restriction endonuclease subunit S [Sphingobacterium humi]|uniref:Restriction endonuclease subunit S n=1 Tax=Sphingobacterium humi TaxID=1796905 RepID=A0A6N8L1X5_9SPHI|nr:restriction endonuclease subunit S [Sphingobacterium humi]MVZ62158.1 restriction endonuclease subunit S [Sphingobacterium humi]